MSRWKVEKVVYLNLSFDSVEELMVACRNGSVYKVFIPAPSYSPEKSLFFVVSAPRGLASLEAFEIWSICNDKYCKI